MRFPLLYAISFYMVPSVAGANNLVQKDYDILPAMGKNIWDGIPSPMFTIEFFDPLLNAIGAVSENGATLLLTYQGLDPGGRAVGANPHYAIAGPVIRQQNANRIRRLFACLLNYICPCSLDHPLYQ